MGSLNKEILRLAVPSIFANITVPLVGMVDIAVAGHLSVSVAGGAAALIGGITVGSMLFDLLYWNFGFLRAGTGGLTAQAYGRKDFRAAADILTRSFGIALASSLLLIAIQWLFVDFAFMFVKSTPEVKALASRYFYIRIWAAPATLSLMAFKGWFIGMQDSFSAMVTDLIVDIVNIVLSIALTFGIPGLFRGMGFSGIAVGTLVAQYSGFLFAVSILLLKYRNKVFEGYGLKDAVASFKGPDTARFFKMNGNLFVRSICFILVYVGYTTIAARYGDVALASSAIIMKLMMLFSYITDGFAYAGEALTGRFIGEKNQPMLSRTVCTTFVWSMAVAVLFVFINCFGADLLFKIMTSDDEVASFSHHFIIWLMIVPLVGCPAFMWDGIYVGATRSVQLRNASLLSAAAFFATWFILGGIVGILHSDQTGSTALAASQVLLAAYTAHLVGRTLWLTASYRTSIRADR